MCIRDSTKTCAAGLGRHMQYLTVDELVEALHIGYLSLLWGFLSPMAGRLAFCTFMIWVAGSDTTIKKWPIYFFIGLQIVANIAQVILALVQCGNDMDLMWDITRYAERNVKCWSPIIQTDYGYVSGCE